MKKYYLFFLLIIILFNCSLFDRPERSFEKASTTTIISSTTPTISNFISVWKTDNTTAGSSNLNQIKLPLNIDGVYNFTVNWGDGQSNIITKYDDSSTTHTYQSAGVYTVTISNVIRGFVFNGTGDRNKIIEIKNWGALNLGNSGNYFEGCNNLTITANNLLDLTWTTNFRFGFANCSSLTTIPQMNKWNVTNITDMSNMFYESPLFNQDISNWNVSNVTNMSYMFFNAKTFNQNIGNWTVSNVIDMNSMFLGASAFNQNISNWNVSKVLDMSRIFWEAAAFNQNISGWDVSSATNMYGMFYYTLAFDQDIGSWHISNVTNMTGMFSGVTLSSVNYDSILKGWSLRSVKQNVTFDAGYSIHGSDISVTNAISILKDSPNNWIIIDGVP